MRGELAVDDVSNAFKPPSTNWPFVDVEATGFAIDVVHQEVTANVEKRIDASGYEG